MNIAIVGATGLVGTEMLKVLSERNFPVSNLFLVASERSKGKQIMFMDKMYSVITIEEALTKKIDIALFSAGGSTSLKWAPEFQKIGAVVIDNSSAWRMDATKKLIVPEINGNSLTSEDKIIANPNCSTIQMVAAIGELHKKYQIKRLVISTYQSITGTGIKAVNQLENERNGVDGEMAYPYAIDKNCIPHCDDFTENGYTKEEMKLVNETRKILEDDTINITATAVRIPVMGGHSESVNLEFETDFTIEQVKQIIASTQGVVVKDDIENNIYPMCKFAEGFDEVFVGRIRRDYSNANSLNMWIVADNLRKGAATNAIQIAEYLIHNKIL